MTTDNQREKITEYARNAVRRTVFEAVRDAGGELVDRLISPRHPDWGMTKDTTAADGLVATRAVELAASGKVREYIRLAREDGHSWRKIGELLGLQQEARLLDEHIADRAFEIAAGRRDDRSYWHERYFSWRCPECEELLQDFGPEAYPEPGRGSHKDGCKRLTVERRAYSLYCRENDNR